MENGSRWTMSRHQRIDVGQKRVLRQYYSVLYRLTGVIIDFVSADGEALTLCEYERFNEFCRLIQASPEGREACRRCDRASLRRVRESGASSVYECHAGLLDIAAPLFAGDAGVSLTESLPIDERQVAPRLVDVRWRRVGDDVLVSGLLRYP